MANSSGTAADWDALVTALDTFAVANGWTQDEITLGDRYALHKNNVYVSMRWNTADPTNVAMFQALGWTSSTLPGNHPDDSGTPGTIDATPDNDDRGLGDLPGGPYDYFFFADPGGPQEYIHVVLSASDGTYRHFGFGELDKFPNQSAWTGGEYLYGTNWRESTTLLQNTVPYGIFDGYYLSSSPGNITATIHVEGLTGDYHRQDAATKWAAVGGTFFTSGNTDRAGNPRSSVIGAVRGGPVPYSWSWVVDNGVSDLNPIIPMHLWLARNSENGPRHIQKAACLLGQAPDMGTMNIRNFVEGEEKTIDGDVWKFFPLVLKANSGVNHTKNLGIAYKKIP